MDNICIPLIKFVINFECLSSTPTFPYVGQSNIGNSVSAVFMLNHVSAFHRPKSRLVSSDVLNSLAKRNSNASNASVAISNLSLSICLPSAAAKRVNRLRMLVR